MIVNADAKTLFREWIASQVFDNYCSAADCSALEKHGVSHFGQELKQSKLIVELELKSLGAVNETSLLSDLDSMLVSFTTIDRKLNPKEHEDSIQLICRARNGFPKGLRHQVAEQYILEFCRRNRVKLKKGLFSWEIP